MLLRAATLHRRLKQLLQTHTHFDVATAWASRGKHLELLEVESSRRRLEVRAIVGIAGNATHPDALAKLNRITHGDLRIVPNGNRLFHPKLYLFGRTADSTASQRAWIGSANFTRAAFGGHPEANEEIMVEVGPGETVDALSAWFREQWHHYQTGEPVANVIRRYAEDRKRNPPPREVRTLVSGPSHARTDLLGDRPESFDEYHLALRTCEEMLSGQNWKVLDQEHGSYTAAIRGRRALLLGDASWSELEHEPRQKLTGALRRRDMEWWGLMGQMYRGRIWPTLCRREPEIRSILKDVEGARESAFPDIAVAAMKRLLGKHVQHGTATLLLALARPDRLLSVNKRSKSALAELSGTDASALLEPDGYGDLLQWLYDQPWYADGPPVGEALMIWRLRAALVDAFVYEP